MIIEVYIGSIYIFEIIITKEKKYERYILLLNLSGIKARV